MIVYAENAGHLTVSPSQSSIKFYTVPTPTENLLLVLRPAIAYAYSEKNFQLSKIIVVSWSKCQLFTLLRASQFFLCLQSSNLTKNFSNFQKKKKPLLMNVNGQSKSYNFCFQENTSVSSRASLATLRE